MNKNENKSKFWSETDNKIRILQSELITFLENSGFARIRLSQNNNENIRLKDNKMRLCTKEDMSDFIKEYLLYVIKRKDVFEVFARGIGQYINDGKISLLKKIEPVDDMDSKDISKLYFQNVYCEITSDGIDVKKYAELKHPIWENRIIKKHFYFPKDVEASQFKNFCWLISKKKTERLNSLKSLIGYLLHRNKHGESKAIVLYDENMELNGKANGGTGKTLLGQAINQCREVVMFDGKNLKTGSWFSNQRIELTSDILFYDDFKRDVSLEIFYPVITTGLEVEKKRQQSFFIEYSRSPKVLISSNYLVKADGGSSEKRRKFEFELANHFNSDYTPVDEFGNRFFDGWDFEQWNGFYYFMMQCLQCYLKNGLIKAKPLNLDRAILISSTDSKFVEFAEEYVQTDTWQDKRAHLNKFNEEYSQNTTSHMFTKYLKAYAKENGNEFEDKSSGGEYNYIIKQKQNEEKLQ